MVERKVCSVLDAGNEWGGWMPVQRLTSPLQPGGKSFSRQREGLHAKTVQSALIVILKLDIGGVTSIILVVLSTVNLSSRVSRFPFS